MRDLIITHARIITVGGFFLRTVQYAHCLYCQQLYVTDTGELLYVTPLYVLLKEAMRDMDAFVKKQVKEYYAASELN